MTVNQSLRLENLAIINAEVLSKRVERSLQDLRHFVIVEYRMSGSSRLHIREIEVSGLKKDLRSKGDMLGSYVHDHMDFHGFGFCHSAQQKGEKFNLYQGNDKDSGNPYRNLMISSATVIGLTGTSYYQDFAMKWKDTQIRQ